MWEQQLWLLRWAQPSFPPSCSPAQPWAAQPCPFPGLMSILTSPEVSKECLDVEVGVGHLMILESCSNPSDSGILGFLDSFALLVGTGWFPLACVCCAVTAASPAVGGCHHSSVVSSSHGHQSCCTGHVLTKPLKLCVILLP